MHNYRRVTYEDRCQIYAFLQAGVPKSVIGQEIGFHRSTIYRDIARNKLPANGYEPPRATAQADKRFLRCRRRYRISGDLERRVKDALAKDWSPEQIAGRFKREGVATIGYQTVYRYVNRNGSLLGSKLRRWKMRGAGRLIQRRTRRNNTVGICKRPVAANNRERIGDWERDGMYGANRKQVLVCTDRKTRYTKLARIDKSTNQSIAKLTTHLLRATKRKVLTITNDNGPEFKWGPKLSAPVYFCTPLRPQERGTVENTIGLLRQYIKRTTKLDELKPGTLQQIELKLNLRPRKCLDYRTPYEVFNRKTVALAMAI